MKGAHGKFFVNCDKIYSFFLCAMHNDLVSLPLAFSKQRAKMMAQKLGAAKPCRMPQSSALKG